MNNIEYSIVIPCYNEEDNLEILLNSIQSLSNNNLQIIIVDNGSTDNSNKILKTLSQKISIQNLKIVSISENIGSTNPFLNISPNCINIDFIFF